MYNVLKSGLSSHSEHQQGSDLQQKWSLISKLQGPQVWTPGVLYGIYRKHLLLDIQFLNKIYIFG